VTVCGFGRDARNNPPEAGATNSIRSSLRLQLREQFLWQMRDERGLDERPLDQYFKHKKYLLP
jgi:hypothetical protein